VHKRSRDIYDISKAVPLMLKGDGQCHQVGPARLLVGVNLLGRLETDSASCLLILLY